MLATLSSGAALSRRRSAVICGDISSGVEGNYSNWNVFCGGNFNCLSAPVMWSDFSVRELCCRVPLTRLWVWCDVNMTERYSNVSACMCGDHPRASFTFSGWFVCLRVLISDLKLSPMNQTERFIICEFKSYLIFVCLKESCSFHKYYFLAVR